MGRLSGEGDVAHAGEDVLDAGADQRWLAVYIVDVDRRPREDPLAFVQLCGADGQRLETHLVADRVMQNPETLPHVLKANRHQRRKDLIRATLRNMNS
ncbi:hypothetical protein [Streptomyces sp. NPDC021224]|uniref:hypothetical protein n=1 Tax=unclassified Streptomyces TaxID=2593676 RepID=UPI0037A400F4